MSKNNDWVKKLLSLVVLDLEGSNHSSELSVSLLDREAIVDQLTQKRVIYKKLGERVLRWISFLESKNIKTGDRICLLAYNQIEHIELLLACSRLGAIFVPLNFRLSVGELQEIVDRVDPSFLFFSDCFVDHEIVLSCEQMCMTDINFQQFNNLPNKLSTDFSISDDTDVLMLFTSGSTGRPKGVLLNWKMLSVNQEETIKGWGLRSDDATIVETPFFHTGGYNVLCLPLLSIGGKVVLAEKFDVDNVYQTFERERITVYFGVPTMFQMLSEHPMAVAESFESIRFFVSGGAYCPEELISTFQDKGVAFIQGFGLTEVGPNCFLLGDKDALDKVGSIGRPMPHSKVLLLDDNDELITIPETVGELVIGGEHVCSSYYDEDDQFRESLYWDKARELSYFRTGDLARFDNEGFYYIVGRKKEMYISGGENVYPAEVERKIRLHESIDEVIVVPVSDAKWHEVGLCFYRGSGHEITVDQLREFLNPILSRYKHPHYVVKVDSFPLLPNGKINRLKLKKMAEEYCSGLNANSFKNNIEQEVSL